MKRFKNLLFANGAAADQASAVARAVSLAESNQAELTIMDVIPPVGEEFRTEVIAGRRQVLESLAAPFSARMKIHLDIRTGIFPMEVIRAVLLRGHDLVIKVAENPAFLQMLFGSEDMHLLRKCPCPVWLIKAPEKARYDCILAAVDFDPLQSLVVEEAFNRKILELAGSLALSDSASLHVVHAWEAYGEGLMQRWGDNAGEGLAAYVEKERLRHQAGLTRLEAVLRDRIGSDAFKSLSPSFHLAKGPAKERIAAMAEGLQADLVVMGTVARTGISGFIIGNTAETVLYQLACSVLAVKPPGFVTPLTLAESG